MQTKRGKALFITATGTDVGKTFVTALLVKAIQEAGYKSAYYKAALSGAITTPNGLIPGDAEYVKTFANIPQPLESMVSYVYKPAVSPHLAAKLSNNPINLDVVANDFTNVINNYDYVTVEGSGGIICPLRIDNQQTILLTDVIKKLNLSVIVVADSGLGTINSTLLTIEHLQKHNIKIQGIVLNNYLDANTMHQDNKSVISTLTNIKILTTIPPNTKKININTAELLTLYE